MVFIALECTKCGARLEVDESASTYICQYCHAAHERDYSSGVAPTPNSLRVMAERAIANTEFGKAMQFIEQGLAIDPHHVALLGLEAKAREGLASLSENGLVKTSQELKATENLREAEQYHLQARFILNELQANKKVYGSNSALTGATPANIDLAMQYIDRSLELYPDSPVYLNLQALLLWEGKGSKEEAAKILEKAAALNPRDITIQNNLNAIKSSGCFIATAAFGTPLSLEVDVLRKWRDQRLLTSSLGRLFVDFYYLVSPSVANFIAPRPTAKRIMRWLLSPLVKNLAQNYPAHDGSVAGSEAKKSGRQAKI